MSVLKYYPWDVLAPAKLAPAWELGGLTIAGASQTLAGAVPTVRMDGGGIWKVGFQGVSTHLPAKRRSWGALTRLAQGGVQPIVVPCRQVKDQPYPLVAGSPLESLPDCPHSDGATFSDGSEYASSTMSVQVVADAALRATSLRVDLAVGSDFQGGEFFSIDHADWRWRLYQINNVVENGDGSWTITFDPPLRAAVSAGIFLEFDRPKCVMKIASAGEMDASYETYWQGDQNVNFIEYLSTVA